MLNLRHLQYLNAVYQYKNFTQAGDSLFVSQPTISAAINTLESDLGVKLIERSSKRVIFTYEGEQFMQWVQKILLLCQEAESATRDLSDSAVAAGDVLRLYGFHRAVGFLRLFEGASPGQDSPG